MGGCGSRTELVSTIYTKSVCENLPKSPEILNQEKICSNLNVLNAHEIETEILCTQRKKGNASYFDEKNVIKFKNKGKKCT